jgi:DNA-binding NarL/FixJ family response regulator
LRFHFNSHRDGESVIPHKIRILLADDHAVLRQGLRLLLDAQPDMEVIAEVEDGQSAVQTALRLRPEIVVLDVSMPRLNGLQATKQLKQELPQMKVLALTRHSDNSYLQQLLHAGANGYVLKQSNAEELVRALRVVFAGGTYLDPAVAAKVVAGYTGKLSNWSIERIGTLTEREREVLRLIAHGYSNKEIAGRFELSVKTVEAHKANAMRKLELHSRIDIVRYAILCGWLQET